MSNFKKWLDRLRYKYRVVVMNEETFEEQTYYRVSELNVYMGVATVCLMVALLITSAIIFTPLKEYIPGYGDTNMRSQIANLGSTSDSLEQVVTMQADYIANIKKVLHGDVMPINRDSLQKLRAAEDTLAELDSVDLNFVSESEMELRKEIDQKANSKFMTQIEGGEDKPMGGMQLFPPIEGYVSDHFDADKEHFGIDLVAPENEPIKSVADGVVILSSWTVDTGHIIGVQHENGLVSFYKHNSVLLKKAGDIVKAGEAIAIIGNSGEETTGPHLHFELWHNQTPIDPKGIISFN